MPSTSFAATSLRSSCSIRRSLPRPQALQSWTTWARTRRLARTDIRLLEAARSASLGTHGPTTGLALANLAKPLGRRPLRQASRVKMPAGADVLVDGAPAILVDISTSGAQVVSSTILKPNQRVRLVVTTNGTAGRSAASVIWSSVEMVQDRISCRAGVLFTGAHPEFLASLPPSIED